MHSQANEVVASDLGPASGAKPHVLTAGDRVAMLFAALFGLALAAGFIARSIG